MKTQLTLPYEFNTSPLHHHILIICLLFITACSVLKEKSFFQADSLLRRNSSTEIETEIQTQSQGFGIYTSEDSADKQSYTEIFPEGVFKYSVKDGFEGKAGRGLINERLKEGRRVRDSAELLQSGKLQTKIKAGEHTAVRSRLIYFTWGELCCCFWGCIWGGDI
jgi:hypothetical protein